jgi:hypothetical protein
VDFLVAAVGGTLIGPRSDFASFVFERLSNPLVEVALSLVVPIRPSCRPTGSSGRASSPLSWRASSSAGGRRDLLVGHTAAGTSVWQMVTFLLTRFAFILIGLQLPVVGATVERRSRACLPDRSDVLP